MNEIVKIINNEAVTDTIALAEGSGNQHKNVIELVRNYIKDLNEFGEVAFETRLNPQGSPTEIAYLNEHQATLILTYMKNTERIRTFKKALVKAFFAMVQKLASQKYTDPIQVLNDPAAMRGLLLTYSEMVLDLQATVEAQAPKVAALDRIATANGSTCITDAAKVLQRQPKDLFAYLSSNKWIYRRQGGKGWIAYQNRIQQGLLEHKVNTVSRSDGSEKVVEHVLITPKGMANLARVFPVN